MGRTDEYPATLANTIDSIRASLPQSEEHTTRIVEEVLAAQDMISTTMAQHLESLTSHYGQMATALQESEAGEAFSQEDLRGELSISLVSRWIYTEVTSRHE